MTPDSSRAMEARDEAPAAIRPEAAGAVKRLKPIDAKEAERIRFLHQSLGLNYIEIGERLGRWPCVIGACVRRGYTPTDFGANKRKAPPFDLAIQYDALGTQRALVKHYGVSMKVVNAWCKALGISKKRGGEGPRPKAKRPCPPDFAALYPTMTMEQLRAHYGTHYAAMWRWIDELGLERKPPLVMRRKKAPDASDWIAKFDRNSAAYRKVQGKLPPQRDLYGHAA